MNILNTIAKLLGNDICPKYNKPCTTKYKQLPGYYTPYGHKCITSRTCHREEDEKLKTKNIARLAESRKILGIK